MTREYLQLGSAHCLFQVEVFKESLLLSTICKYKSHSQARRKRKGKHAKLCKVNCERGSEYHVNFDGAKIYMVNQNDASHHLCSPLLCCYVTPFYDLSCAPIFFHLLQFIMYFFWPILVYHVCFYTPKITIMLDTPFTIYYVYICTSTQTEILRITHQKPLRLVTSYD